MPPPTLREIATHLGISGTLGAQKHLTALERKGYIRKEPGSSRGIMPAVPAPSSIPVPIVGTVRAGSLQLALEEIEGYVALDRSTVRGDDCFLLRVKGDSMVNAAILNGDLALVRPQSFAENRDIVVAMVDGEATLKRFFREEDAIRLQPENPAMEPIVVRAEEGEVVVIGRVIGIHRSLE
jgi:repressor LexA